MKAVELDTKKGKRRIELHGAVTVIAVPAEERAAIASALATSLDATPVVRLGAAHAKAGAEGGSGGGGGDALVEAEAALARAESAVSDARGALEAAERSYVSAQDALLHTQREVDREAGAAVKAAEARLEVAQAGAAAARRALVQARESSEREQRERVARDEASRREIAELQEEKAKLDADRAELTAQLAALGAPPDPAPVEEALNGLRRLRQVKPRPSERAAALADRWVEVRERLASLPMPPAPPEWLVTPALAALNEARDALARAEATPGEPADPAKIDAVEKAHRDVLEAEQRVMRKGSRSNRRRLEQSQEAERTALNALGVSSYGEYLQRIAPDLEDGASTEERVAQARAALADAEAVWEELHGGEASPEYTAAKQEEAELRAQAYAILGDQTVDDADLEARLRVHVETVVDTEWAEQQLREALTAQGVDIADIAGDADVEALPRAAEAWLASVPERRAAHEDLEARINALDARLRDVDDALVAHQSGAFFGTDDAESIETRSPEERGAGISPDDPFRELTLALDEAEAAEREASDALAAARRRLEESERAAASASEKERDADVARGAVDAARARLEEAEAALAAAQRASDEAASAAEEAAAAAASMAANAAKASANGAGLADDAWLLARLVAARATRRDAPVVVEAGERTAASPRSFHLLERAAARGQVVVLGDDAAVADWARGLGDRAAIRSI